MASIIINGIQYLDCPEIDVPKVGSGTAKFYDNSEANITPPDIRSGKKGGTNTGIISGTMAEKAAATYNPSTSDQTITANQYLAGAQTIKAVTTSNIAAQYIASGVTVKVGCQADDDCIISVTGTLTSPTISQDQTSKILSIS